MASLLCCLLCQQQHEGDVTLKETTWWEETKGERTKVYSSKFAHLPNSSIVTFNKTLSCWGCFVRPFVSHAYILEFGSGVDFPLMRSYSNNAVCIDCLPLE
jgi:hypothetical protein